MSREKCQQDGQPDGNELNAISAHGEIGFVQFRAKFNFDLSPRSSPHTVGKGEWESRTNHSDVSTNISSRRLVQTTCITDGDLITL